MKLEQVLFFTISVLSAVKPQTNFKQLEQRDLETFHNTFIDYMPHLICSNGSYRFIHIYIERSLTTTMSDKMINRLNDCLTAGILTSRLAQNFFNKA